MHSLRTALGELRLIGTLSVLIVLPESTTAPEPTKKPGAGKRYSGDCSARPAPRRPSLTAELLWPPDPVPSSIARLRLLDLSFCSSSALHSRGPARVRDRSRFSVKIRSTNNNGAHNSEHDIGNHPDAPAFPETRSRPARYQTYNDPADDPTY